MRKPVFGVSDLVPKNRAIQLQKMAKGLKFRIKEVEGLNYPYGENKGADQLRGYREADVCLCFLMCKKPVFSQRGSFSFTMRSVSSFITASRPSKQRNRAQPVIFPTTLLLDKTSRQNRNTLCMFINHLLRACRVNG